MRTSVWKRGATASLIIVAIALLTGCAETMASSDAGCISYAEARLAMPDPATVPGGEWGEWIADTDDRMVGTCA